MSPAGSARPLEGRRVLVTRPRAQAAELVQHLEAAGAEVVMAPSIRIVPPIDREPLIDAAARASSFDWIVFSSANAVDAFFTARAESGEQPALPNVCAVGKRTAERLRERGTEVAIVPDEFRAEALVATLAARTTLRGARVLLPRSEIAREVIADGLREAGALVTDVIAYRTIASDAADAPDVRQLLTDRVLDAVTFTSGSAVRAFVQPNGPVSAVLLRNTVVAVIGPVTADAARELGIEVRVQPSTYTAAAMVDALAGYFASQP